MFRKLFGILATAFALNAFAAVDANRASQAELETVKGIGPSLLAKILKAREAGTFKDWNEMVNRVGGIGPGNAAKFSQAGLTVGGTAYDPAAQPAPAKATKAAVSSPDAAVTKAPKTPAKGS